MNVEQAKKYAIYAAAAWLILKILGGLFHFTLAVLSKLCGIAAVVLIVYWCYLYFTQKN